MKESLPAPQGEYLVTRRWEGHQVAKPKMFYYTISKSLAVHIQISTSYGIYPNTLQNSFSYSAVYEYLD